MVKLKVLVKNKKIIFKLLIVFVVLVVLAVGGYFGYSYYKKLNKKDEKISKVSDREYNLEKSNYYGIAYEKARNNGYDSGIKYLDEKLNSAKNPEDKSDIIIYKSYLTASEFKLDQKKALEYAYQAEKINPTTSTALCIATKEEALANPKTALAYYKKYLDRMNSFLKSYKGDMKSIYEREYNEYTEYVKKLEETIK